MPEIYDKEKEEVTDNPTLDELEKQYAMSDKNDRSDGENLTNNSSISETTAPTDLYKSDSPKLRTFKLPKTFKKKYLYIGLGALIPIILIVLLLFFMSLLKIPNYAANIAAYRLARTSMQYAKASAYIDGEKIAIDSADNGAYSGLKQKYGNLRNTTWGKLDQYRPQKVYENMRGTNRITYEYTNRKILGVDVPKLKYIVIDGEKIPALDKRFGHPITNYADRIKLATKLESRVGDALQSKSSYIRSGVAKSIRTEMNITLTWWEKAGIKYLGLSSDDADHMLLKDSRTKITTEFKPPTTKSLAKATEATLKDEADCIEDKKCGTDMAKKSGFSQWVSSRLDKSLGESTFKKIALGAVGVINPAFDIAVPACLIYDGSMYNPGSDIDSLSTSSTRSFYALGSAADQQKTGDTTAEAVGAFNRKLEDDYGAVSVPDQYSSGDIPDTSLEKSPQSNILNQLTITDTFIGNKKVADVVNSIATELCPKLTDVKTMAALGVGVLVARVVAAIFTGGGSEGGTTAISQTIKQTLKTVVDKMSARQIKKTVLDKLESIWKGTVTATVERRLLKTIIQKAFPKGGFARRFLRDFALIEGGTALAKLIVLNKAGIVNDGGTYKGTDFINQADMGADLHGNDINRKMFYGAPMDDKNISASDKLAAMNLDKLTGYNSAFDKYFSLANQKSITYKFLYKAKHVKNIGINKLAFKFMSVINPFGLFKVFNPNQLAYASSGSASGHYGIVQWGWTAEEYRLIDNANGSYGILENAQILADSGRTTDIETKYGKCFSETMGTLLENGDIKRTENGNIVASDGDCSPTKLGPKNNDGFGDLVFRYRLYKMYENTLDHNLGIQNPTASSTAPTTTTANNKVYFLGDSIGAGASAKLKDKLNTNNWNSTIEALSSRTLTGAAPLGGTGQVQQDATRIRDIGSGAIVVELGTNNCTQTSSTFTNNLEKLYGELQKINKDAKYYWVNYAFKNGTLACKTSHMGPRNTDLSNFARSNNITIIDWSSIGVPFLDSSGVHPTSAGQEALAKLIADDTLGKK